MQANTNPATVELLPPPVVIETLREALPTMRGGDAEFIGSLLNQWNRYGRWSDKQWACARRKADMIRNPKPAEPAKTAKVSDGLTAVVAMFDKARTHLKAPAVLVASDAGVLRLKIAGPTSRHAGQLFVLAGERDDRSGDRAYLGRVDKSGVYFPARDARGAETAIGAALEAFAADPARRARDFARLTGRCCFCNQTLKDERSTAVGYGETCAAHFSLPWGAA